MPYPLPASDYDQFPCDLPLRRTPARRALLAIVTSDHPLAYYTHYWHDRTRPCFRDPCEACLDGIPSRWRAYLTAVDLHSAEPFIFECTSRGAEAFHNHLALHKTLRGCHFKATRYRRRKNGRILIATRLVSADENTLPAAPDLEAALSKIWRVPVNRLRALHTEPATS